METTMQSPWGMIQQSEEIVMGVCFVSTAGHGGFMITEKAMERFHPALKYANVYGGSQGEYTCFEEDCEAVAVAFELKEAGIETKFKATKEDVIAYLGRGDTYKQYLNLRGLITI